MFWDIESVVNLTAIFCSKFTESFCKIDWFNFLISAFKRSSLKLRKFTPKMFYTIGPNRSQYFTFFVSYEWAQ
jgi:hypothetical protein